MAYGYNTESHLFFIVLELLLNNIPQRRFNPSACQKVILVNPNINGINQFHNHFIGNANKKHKITAIAKTPGALIDSSMILNFNYTTNINQINDNSK